ncbi:laccase-17-like [Hibiscus syriacus]|uniref:Laccase-17-like n=1 Tax=Hibiscus syriacus TaxID=106335 RepID=A0A6A3BVY1_HIBSY|nr:laccase-17-like [Hibiscus syriacus]
MRLNAIAIDPRNPNYFAIGGSDEYERVYDFRKYPLDASNVSETPVNVFCPRHLLHSNHIHITGLAYSNTSELLVSYNDELIYLFQKNMGLGPSPLSLESEAQQRDKEPQVYVGHRNSRTVKGSREDQSPVTLPPDVIMHVLCQQRRQMFGYVERRYSRADLESDGDDADEDYISGLSNDIVVSEEDPGENSGDCKIS